ncbi:hypothetical protein AB0L40_08400 [Patulibacter sp. NPDC049589]|uniref:hypothetical protein n=1 Tax=Patulibacter sp. NPDC049589 TaxID=3154731 RepID=UPI003412A05D
MSTRPTRDEPDGVIAPEIHATITTAITAQAAANRPRRHRHRRPMAIAVAVAVVLAVVFVVSLGSSGPGGPSRAQASAAILRTPPIDGRRLPALRDLVGRIGTVERLRRVWAAPALGGQIYLAHGDGVWCLSVPDRATDHPDVERAVGCTTDREFDRIGISLTLGSDFVAVLPDGVTRPTTKRPGGRARPVTPSSEGVVALRDLPAKTVVTVTGTDGAHRRLAIADTGKDKVKFWTCPDGQTRVTGPKEPNPC